MFELLRALSAGVLLRCPRCWRGQMFERYFTMREHCSECGLPFEHASGEITGGMGVNLVTTLFLAMAMAIVISAVPSLPLVPSLLVTGIIVVLFSIFFYPISRGIWAGFLYVTGDNGEPD